MSANILREKEVCQLLGITPRTLRLYRKRRSLPYHRLSHKVIVYRESDLLAWIDRHRVAVKAN